MESHSPAEYIVIDGLELMYATMYGYNDGWPMDYEVRGLTIRNCHIGYIGDPQAAPNDFTSMGIYLWGESALFTDFRIYNNVLMRIKQKALILNNVQKTQVFHNTFWSMNERAGVLGTSTEYRGLVTVAGAVGNLSFDNNLLYGSVRSDQYHLQLVSFSGGSESGVVSMDHNLYFRRMAHRRWSTPPRAPTPRRSGRGIGAPPASMPTAPPRPTRGSPIPTRSTSARPPAVR